jgi:hypothetical protein
LSILIAGQSEAQSEHCSKRKLDTRGGRWGGGGGGGRRNASLELRNGRNVVITSSRINCPQHNMVETKRGGKSPHVHATTNDVS